MRTTVWKETSGAGAVYYATVVSLVVWMGVCVYYAVVEGFITTVAHLVAFGVGAGALLFFEALFLIPRDAGFSAYLDTEATKGGLSGGNYVAR